MKLNEHYFSEFGSPVLEYIHTTPIVNKLVKFSTAEETQVSGSGGRDSGIRNNKYIL